MSAYTTVNGQTVHKAVAAAFFLMAAAFYLVFGEHLLISSGRRSYAEGVKLFTTRYRVQWTGSGPFRDVKWWKGKRWVRYSSNGTVAIPGTSLHESDRAIDIRDSGADPGVTRAGEPESNWIKANARRFGFNPRGFTFGEPWHLEYLWALIVPAGFDVIPIEPEPLTPPRSEMTTNYVKISTGDKKGGPGSLWATAGDAGMPCPGNWIEFVRTPADGSINDRGARMAAAHGFGIALSDAEWAEYRSGYTTPPLPIDTTTIGSAIAKAITTALGGLSLGPTADEIAQTVLDKQAERLQE